LGIIALIGIAAHSVTNDIKENIGFVIEVKNNASDKDIDKLKQELSRAPYVSSHVYTAAEDILQEEAEAMGEDIVDLIDTNPYNAEFEVKVKSEYAREDSINAIAARLSKNELIENVRTQALVVENVNETLGKISLILVIVAGALLVISFVLINNTVSLSIYSRRFIIHTMKLVGATGGFIRRPFVISGIINGFIAALIAIILLIFTVVYITNIDSSAAAALKWNEVVIIMGGLVIVGMLICAIASTIATNRYLRQNYDAMFRR
jgi:cell division transport system permease protein